MFKGGTCLKKCFVETYRFSEDLDFTVLDGGPLEPDDLLPVLTEMLDLVTPSSRASSSWVSLRDSRRARTLPRRRSGAPRGTRTRQRTSRGRA